MSEGAASVPPSLDKAKLYYLNLVTDIDVTPIIEVCKAIGAEEVKFESLPKGTYNLVLIAHGDKKGKSLFSTVTTVAMERDELMKTLSKCAGDGNIGVWACICHGSTMSQFTGEHNVSWQAKSFEEQLVSECARWLESMFRKFPKLKSEIQQTTADIFWANALEYPSNMSWESAFKLLADICRKGEDIDVSPRKNTIRYGFLKYQGAISIDTIPIVSECQWSDVLQATEHWTLLRIVYSFANHPKVEKVYIGMTYLSENGSSNLGGLATRGLGYEFVILIARGAFEAVKTAEDYLHRAVIHPKKKGDNGYPGRGQSSLYGLYLCFSNKMTSNEEDKIPVFYRTPGQTFMAASVSKNEGVGTVFKASAVWKEVDDILTPYFQALNLSTHPVESGKYYVLPKEEERIEPKLRNEAEPKLRDEAERLFGGVISMYEKMLVDEKDPEAVRFLENRVVLYKRLLDAYETIIEEHEKMWVGVDLNSSAPLRFGNSKDEVLKKFFSGQAEDTYLIDFLLRPRDMKREYVDEEVVFLRKSNGLSLYCDAEVDGKAVEFKLDTGADGILLSPVLHKNITMYFDRDPGRDLETASGDTYSCFSKMCEVRFGKIVLRARVSTFERAQRNLFGMEGINHFDLVVTSESSEGRKLVFGTDNNASFEIQSNENNNNDNNERA